jgi:hypothetical protein
MYTRMHSQKQQSIHFCKCMHNGKQNAFYVSVPFVISINPSAPSFAMATAAPLNAPAAAPAIIPAGPPGIPRITPNGLQIRNNS